MGQNDPFNQGDLVALGMILAALVFGIVSVVVVVAMK